MSDHQGLSHESLARQAALFDLLRALRKLLDWYEPDEAWTLLLRCLGDAKTPDAVLPLSGGDNQA